MLATVSSTCSEGVDGGSIRSELGTGECGWGYGDVVDAADIDEARRVALVDADDVVESSISSTTSQVCKVASGAKDTRRFAAHH